jgi:hypothetical protein
MRIRNIVAGVLMAAAVVGGSAALSNTTHKAQATTTTTVAGLNLSIDVDYGKFPGDRVNVEAKVTNTQASNRTLSVLTEIVPACGTGSDVIVNNTTVAVPNSLETFEGYSIAQAGVGCNETGDLFYGKMTVTENGNVFATLQEQFHVQ